MAMSTSVDCAADADDGVQNHDVSRDPLIGDWTDTWTNHYKVTGSNGKYSVTATQNQDGKRRGQTETFKDIITRAASGDYMWGRTHRLRIRVNGHLDWIHLAGKLSWRWMPKKSPSAFDTNETSLSVPMSELQARLRLCLGSTLTRELRS